MPFNAGDILNGRYRMDALLGKGGYGAVYQAWDLNLECVWAVKENLDASPEAQRQFMREARLLAGLRHPNLPRVNDYFSVPGVGQYLVMDFVTGDDLRQILRKNDHRPLSLPLVLKWADQVGAALSYLHTQNPPVIHRDVKPANIKITASGDAVLVDFGIAKVFDPEQKTTTAAQAVTGGFSPLEQYGGGITDERSDVYALAATLYNLLSGVVPVDAVARAAKGQALIPLCSLNPAVPPSVAAAIDWGMMIEPQRRCPNVASLLASLRAPAPVLMETRPESQLPPEPPPAVFTPYPAAAAQTQLPLENENGPRWWMWAVGGAGLLVLMGIVLALVFSVLTAQPQWLSMVNSSTPTQAQLLTSTALFTPQPRRTQTATLTPLPERTIGPTRVRQILRAETALPDDAPELTRGNSGDLGLIARWGRGSLVEAAASKDGARLLVASAAGLVLYDDTWQIAAEVELPGLVRAAAISEDGSRIAAAMDDNTLALWMPDTGSRPVIWQSSRPAVSLAFSPDGTLLAAMSGDSDILLWEAGQQVERLTLNGSTWGAVAGAFSPDGERFISGFADGTMRIWKVEDGSLLQRAKLFSDGVSSLAFSPDGRTIAAGSYGNKIIFWDTLSAQAAGTLTGHQGWIRSLVFNRDGSQLASASDDGTARVWSVRNGSVALNLKTHQAGVTSVSFTGEDKYLVTTSLDQTVKEWDQQNGEARLTLTDYTAALHDLAAAPNGKWLAAGAEDGSVLLWTVLDGSLKLRLSGHEEPVLGVAFSPDSRQLASGGYDETIHIWNPDSGSEEMVLRGHDDAVDSLAYSPDGGRLASASFDGFVRIWPADGGDSEMITIADGRVHAVAYGSLLATAGQSGLVRIWDLREGRELKLTLGSSAVNVNALCLIPGQKWVAAGEENGEVRLWHMETGKEMLTLTGHTGAVLALAASPNGQLLATAGQDGIIKVWDTSIGRLLITLEGRRVDITGLAFTPDGRWLVSAAADGTLSVWGAGE
ncbi:MAG TPA: protein kinase [Anaerolineaceae bacterium]|nr:protein kinase [Anaerolineaceae bacterium]HPN51590.1 protein kinase [Anaerolineaceae bacterium]